MATPELHELCRPIAWLLGTWVGEGVGGYPTMEGFRYREESTFSHNGKPFLAYAQKTWAVEDDRPLHAETGYWRPQADGTLEVVMAHPTGVMELYYGTVDEAGQRLEIATDAVLRTSTAKEVTALHRMYGLVADKLMYAVDMAAMGEPLQSHLSAALDRSRD